MIAAQPTGVDYPLSAETAVESEYYQRNSAHPGRKPSTDFRKPSHPLFPFHGSLALLTRYLSWKQKLIQRALERHESLLSDVERLGDPVLTNLYDQVLGALSGPHTIRLRQAPQLSGALRLHRSQKSFARALHHRLRLADLQR